VNVTKENRSEDGRITIFQLIPLFIATTIFMVAEVILSKHYGDSGIVLACAAFLGVISWILYALIIRILLRKR
jgi:hypothetical protein